MVSSFGFDPKDDFSIKSRPAKKILKKRLTKQKKYVMCYNEFIKNRSRRTEMVKNIDCPICEKGKLQLNITNGYKVVFEGKMSELPCKIYCKNCRRFIKYKVEKEED